MPKAPPVEVRNVSGEVELQKREALRSLCWKNEEVLWSLCWKTEVSDVSAPSGEPCSEPRA